MPTAVFVLSDFGGEREVLLFYLSTHLTQCPCLHIGIWISISNVSYTPPNACHPGLTKDGNSPQGVTPLGSNYASEIAAVYMHMVLQSHHHTSVIHEHLSRATSTETAEKF
jgi:hypothetical protein